MAQRFILNKNKHLFRKQYKKPNSSILNTLVVDVAIKEHNITESVDVPVEVSVVEEPKKKANKVKKTDIEDNTIEVSEK